MNNRIKSLALLVNLGIYGVAFPLSGGNRHRQQNRAAEETMVVTAAEQNLQAPGVRPSPPMKSVNARPRATSRKSSAPCRALT
jgi:hypothetical protein